MSIQQIRLPDGTEVVVNEWIGIPKFSTIEFGAGLDVNLRAFTYVVGNRVPQQGTIPVGANRTADEKDTNITTRNRLNHDQAFIAYSMTYELFALSDAELTITSPDAQTVVVAPAPIVSSANLRRLQRDLVISLTIGANIDKPQARFPFAWMGQGVGPVYAPSSQALAALNSFSAGTGGRVSPVNQRAWKLPVFIQPDQVFFVLVQSQRSPRNATAAPCDQAISMRLYIDGLNRRPVA
jgi:hypothetical protein